MLRYGLYTRKSDDDRSVTEKSIGEQVAECKRLAERDKLDVYKDWEESKSARYPHKRPNYSELIKLIERGRIDGIICWHVNRLVRNMEEGGKLAQLLIEGNIKEIRTPSAIYRTGDNIMPLVIEAASATQFSLDHGRTVSRGMDGSFRAGGCTCKAPQGYRNARNPLDLKKGMVEKDPLRFKTVRCAWDLLLTGTQTVKQVTDTMNKSWGFRTKATKKGGNRPLSYTGAYFIFTNPFYAGFVRRRGELVKGLHEAMITPDEFERVQAILRRRSFSAPRTREFAYTGLMHCVHCGQQVTGEVKTLRDGRLWENYHCSDSKLTCTKLGLSKKNVTSRIREEFDNTEIEPELLTIAMDNILRSLGMTTDGTNKILEAQEAALKQTTDRLRRLDEMWLDCIVTDEVRYKEMENRERTRKIEITMEIERIKNEAERMRLNLERGKKFLSDAHDEFDDDQPRRAKELCRSLATDYIFDGRAKTIEIQIHPILKEMVKYARSIDQLESPKNGSRKEKEPTSDKSVLFGGRTRRQIEPPASLLDALKGELFPDLWPDVPEFRMAA